MPIQTAIDSISRNQGSPFGFKNRIINGGMTIDQRYAGASVTPTSAIYTLDRWLTNGTQSSKFSVQQNAGSVTPPPGFINYLGVTSLSSYSVGASDFFSMVHTIEGNNVADLDWGKSTAKTITLSFWVRSSLTGTFGGSLNNNDFTRSYPFSYTINQANTWELETITIPGDVTGTWLTNNGKGVHIYFSLGTGSTNSGTAGAWTNSTRLSTTGAVSVVGTNAATWYITGVQFEVGNQASSFDWRPYGTELALCQRYCKAFSSYPMGRARDGDTVYGPGIILGTTMRATPTLRSGASFIVGGGTAGTPVIISNVGYVGSPDIVMVGGTGSAWTTNVMVALTGIFEAEL